MQILSTLSKNCQSLFKFRQFWSHWLISTIFQEQNYPPEVSGVIPSIIQSTYKVYNECVAVLLKEDPTRFVHLVIDLLAF